jgi:hypothetical protein
MGLIIATTCVTYLLALNAFCSSGIPLRWLVFFWFFGACLVSAAVIGAYDFTQTPKKKRHATINK